MFKPRPKQQEVLDYAGGKMGICAVPGSGKTYTLSYLAAKIVASANLAEDQEVLVVTVVNSAVDYFASRIRSVIRSEHNMLSLSGYRVRTLHGLAHDIVRERPGLVGLSEDFQIIDEQDSVQIRNNAALAWVKNNANILERYLSSDLDENKLGWIRSRQLPDLANTIALQFIRSAKNKQLTPEQLRQRLGLMTVDLPLANMGCDIYASYQRALAYRGAVDFDDLVRLAIETLRLDEKFLERCRNRWPYILEDEAQDSNPLQEQLLRLLVGEDGNWVRVGDPNQAIFLTFTTADPRFLRNFMNEADQPRELPNSGRSTQSIINLANYLVRWTQNEHPQFEARDALVPPYIEAAPIDDAQPNPEDNPAGIRIFSDLMNQEDELRIVANSIADWLPNHPDSTVAVLVPTNEQGHQVVDALKKKQLAYSDTLLRTTHTSRITAGALDHVLIYLADPHDAAKLSKVYEVWRRATRNDNEAWRQVLELSGKVRQCRRVEDFLWPQPDRDWLANQKLTPDQRGSLGNFRELVRRWQDAVLLPIDQLIISLAQDLFAEPDKLATAHKLAAVLRQARKMHPEWQIDVLSDELGKVAKDRRRFLGFSEDDTGFEPERYKGEVVVATIHKAKGLEWDRVYILSVNNFVFPSTDEDPYHSDRWFVRDRLDLPAESLAQLDALISGEAYTEGEPTIKARLNYIRERLRLLYVGVTRAKRELIITWNTGKAGKKPSQPAIPLRAMSYFWETQSNEASK